MFARVIRNLVCRSPSPVASAGCPDRFISGLIVTVPRRFTDALGGAIELGLVAYCIAKFQQWKLGKKYAYRDREYPQLLDAWNASFLCNKCGASFAV